MKKDLLLVHTENFQALAKKLGWPRYVVYTALCWQLWNGIVLPEGDGDLAKIADVPLQTWLKYKPSIWPKIVDHSQEWVWADQEGADLIKSEPAENV
jgi:hypothetical protein